MEHEYSNPPHQNENFPDLPDLPEGVSVQDLSPGDFLKPSPETRKAFNEAVQKLPFVEGDRTRITGGWYPGYDPDSSDIDPQGERGLSVRVLETFDADGAPVGSSVQVTALYEGEPLRVRASGSSGSKFGALHPDMQAWFKERVDSVASNPTMSPEEQQWLRDAWATATNVDRGTVAAGVSRLLEKQSPDEVAQYWEERADVLAGHGQLHVTRMMGVPGFRDALPADREVVKIDALSNTRYTYVEQADGGEQLVTFDADNPPQYMDEVPSDVSEGKLRELTTVIQGFSEAAENVAQASPAPES